MANQRRRVRSIKYTKHVDPQGTHVSLELSEMEEWPLETAAPDASSVKEAKKRIHFKKTLDLYWFKHFIKFNREYALRWNDLGVRKTPQKAAA